MCGGDTGHAEAIRVTFDADAIGYGELLDIFFAIHDPTQLNRQGRHRHAISLGDLPPGRGAARGGGGGDRAGQREHDGKVVTTIEPKAEWYPAEDYHQDYWSGEGQSNPYCIAVIPPKLQKLRKSFQARVKSAA